MMYCGRCYCECEPVTCPIEAMGEIHTEVISDCCEAEVYTETDREHRVTVIELPAADRWMDSAI